MSPSSILTNSNLLRQNVPQFTSITHFGECIDSGIAQCFIKQSATTLESLEIRNRGLRFIEGCIYRDDGRPMTYPRLKKLEIVLSIENRESPIELRGTELGVIFPALQSLRLHPSRIFNDYALFKSCSTTLIGLDLELDREIVDILQRSNPFWSGKDSQLSHISLRPAYGDRPSMSADDFVRFVFGLCTPATRALSLIVDIPHSSIMRVAPECPYAKNLQILDIQECHLSMLQMLAVIEILPGLTDFSCGFAGIDMQLCQWDGLALPNYFRRRCYPLSLQLKCWHVYPVDPPPTGAIALVAITLATVCPKFTCVQLQGGDIAYMFSELSTGLDKGIYREHQETVKKLFYI
ncbi:hypothetical protein GGI23_005209 [Coemansia sp. RSA 2559]|nr:hypothetical protein GGI23_005209 [Coemansia sp. RSA 2559]